MPPVDISILYKISWLIRAFFYKPLFGKIATPSCLGKPSFLYGTKKIYIQKRVRIFPGIRMEVHGAGELHIKKNVVIGQNLHITCAGKMVIESGTAITNNVTITDIIHNYDKIGTPINKQPITIKKISIGENCFIGSNVSIQAGTTLGNHCIVGSNSVVRGNYPDYSVIAGAPAKILKKYNKETHEWETVNH